MFDTSGGIESDENLAKYMEIYPITWMIYLNKEIMCQPEDLLGRCSSY